MNTGHMDDVDTSPLPVESEETKVILAAVDTSTLASEVIEFAARSARRTWPSAQLHVLHVFRSTRVDRPSSIGLNRESLLEDARSYLEHHVRAARKLCTSPVIGLFAEGDPSDEIVRAASSINADLVVLGTEDRAGIERFLLRSIAAKVAKRAPCSVLIVRRKQRPYVRA
jgi:universal stress protein A